MINGFHRCWSSDLLYENIDGNQYLDNFISSVLSDLDLDHTPSDFDDTNLIENHGENYVNFKNHVVVPAFQKFIAKSFNLDLLNYDFFLRSWMAGIKNGYDISIHNHAGAAVSAVFYLLCQDSCHGGDLVLTDPRANANRGYQREFKKNFENIIITPRSGDIVIFPSFVYHHTTRFTGNLRLAMPVDLFIK